MSNNQEHLAQIEAAVKVIRQGEGLDWTPAYGEAHQFLTRLLEADLSRWIKEYPPQIPEYQLQPLAVIDNYYQSLRPELSNKVVENLLFTKFERFAEHELKKLKTKASKSEKDKVAQRFPGYLTLRQTIRETKKSWKDHYAAIKRSPSFRVMGGLAQLGAPEGNKYRRLVKAAQQMESTVLGKALTTYSPLR